MLLTARERCPFIPRVSPGESNELSLRALNISSEHIEAKMATFCMKVIISGKEVSGFWHASI